MPRANSQYHKSIITGKIMKTMKPPTRPKMTEAEILNLLKPFAIDRIKYPVVVVGIRGYYEDSMGKPQANDRGIYDDAIFIVSPVLFKSFNANTDPSKFRAGTGTGNSKGIASLVPGLYFAHKLDMHNGKYLALCQRVMPVKVMRDGASETQYKDEGMFGINIHRGGLNTTGSEGCQTIPPSQWTEFIEDVVHELQGCCGSKYRSAVVPYLLIDKA
jgi:hypothetical protein